MLEQYHSDMLRNGSAISQEVIEARGYRTVTSRGELAGLGFAPVQQRAPGLLIPLWTTDGIFGLWIYRPDNPRVLEDQRRRNPDGTFPNRVIKYEMPKGAGVRLDCPPPCQPKLQDPGIPLWITEGQKKADSLASAGLCAIALLGVWNFKGRNELGASTFLADWDYVALKGREVRIVFDSDVMSKHGVRQALDRLTAHLRRKGAQVDAVYLPTEPGRGKVGVDDWLAAGHTREELETLVEAPRPVLQPARPRIRLLSRPPSAIRRPLSKVDGVMYAAAWLYVEKTVTEKVGRNGEIQRIDPPLVTQELGLYIVREDGVIFGEEGDRPMEELGLAVRLPEVPPLEKTWSFDGVQRYHAGQRPHPADVFRRVTEVVGRFIDFERSLAPQPVMEEMLACYILATWFLEAFNVVGYLWPNGDKGCGKTSLLMIVAELGHLGLFTTAGGSHASLRDLADYGATVAIDDAENLADPHKTDPDKRALLMAGNRRGVTITIKEQKTDKTWRIRHVNAFCPRLFSATQLPDTVLASRSIVIPLVRTVDRERANLDPQDQKAWPHPRQELLDDLWALGLAYTRELAQFDEFVGKYAVLSGRSLQPWRGTLAVAKWLEENGVAGLWGRMEKLSMDYQAERLGLEHSDFTTLTIRAMLEVVELQLHAHPQPACDATVFEMTTGEITEMARTLASQDEGSFEVVQITSLRVGQVLRKMRLRSFRKSGRLPRGWQVTAGELKRLASSYGIPLTGGFFGKNNAN